MHPAPDDTVATDSKSPSPPPPPSSHLSSSFQSGEEDNITAESQKQVEERWQKVEETIDNQDSPEDNREDTPLPQKMSPPIPLPTTTPPPPSHLSNFSEESQSGNIPDIQCPQDETEKESTQREIVKPEYITPAVSQSSILVNITCTFVSLFHNSL